MSRLSKILSFTVLLVFLLACNFVSQPLNDAQNLAQTAQAVASSLPIETLQAAASQIASAIPAETFQALPSAFPTFEALGTAINEAINPEGTPLQEWQGIPIMPQAIAGEELSGNTYSFKANVTAKEVQDFYNAKLPELGWSQLSSLPTEFGATVFRKEQSSLAIAITPSEGSVVVFLVLTQA